MDLTESNPTHAALKYPLDVMAAFQDSRILLYEPLPKGSWTAREAVAEYYSRRGHHVSPDRILLTASTSEAYSYLFKLLTDPGGRCWFRGHRILYLSIWPPWNRCRWNPYSLHYMPGGRWTVDAMPHGACAVALVNPNNPTGSFVKGGELDQLVRLGTPLISDEVFSDYAFAPDPDRVPTLVDVDECLTFSMSGLRK